ncbi:HNH endonuclease [Metabacillus litoralis]|uniref:HNH endonuclease n=1 Tax=Metabacillus litoralis TaxID=152268 RepID=UPI001CFD7FA7|nr:HNH endonuclease [Metabacillus litoralis]
MIYEFNDGYKYYYDKNVGDYVEVLEEMYYVDFCESDALNESKEITENFLENQYGCYFDNEDDCYTEEDYSEIDCISFNEEIYVDKELDNFTSHFKMEYVSVYEKQVFKNMLSDSSEETIEHIMENEELAKLKINCEGSIEMRQAFIKVRKANRTTVDSLKEYYNFCCQICGENHFDKYNVNIVEAHHIEPFSETQNHDPSNIIILCPNHHRIVHRTNAVFDREREVFIYENGFREKLNINKHL